METGFRDQRSGLAARSRRVPSCPLQLRQQFKIEQRFAGQSRHEVGFLHADSECDIRQCDTQHNAHFDREVDRDVCYP